MHLPREDALRCCGGRLGCPIRVCGDPRHGRAVLRPLASRLLLVMACVIGISAMEATTAYGQTPSCRELETTEPAPENAQNLIELAPNAARPTFDVGLDYSTDGKDDISFPAKAGRRPGRDADVAAEFIDAPRYKGHALKGDRSAAAHASKSGRSILLYACFDNIPHYAAGRWEGTVAIFGPELADFTYAIVVTTKWPRWTAWAVILVTIVGSLIVAILTGVLNTPKNWKDGLKIVFTLVIALVLGLLPYWSVYVSNETWGSTPPSDLIALASATFGAVIGGFALAKKLLSA